MKIYQTNTLFVRFDNETFCTINARVELHTGTYSFSAQGKAKCHPDDQFDSKLGERIAESRASSKLYHKIHKEIRKQAFLIRKDYQILMRESRRIFDIAEKEEEHYCELLK